MRSGYFFCKRGGIEASVVKIIFITVALALVAVAIKLSYDALEAGRSGSDTATTLATIKNLTAQISSQ